MKGRFLVTVFVSLMIISIFASASAFCGDYVIPRGSGVYIRTGPSTSRFVIGEASKGEIYNFIAEVDGWYKIELFTGEYRYISKSFSARLKESEVVSQHYFVLPSSKGKRRNIYERILRAKRRAQREAEEIIPGTLDKERNTRYRKILEDRYILKVFQNHTVHPGLYRDLIEEGVSKAW